jgi:hypothetical protein
MADDGVARFRYKQVRDDAIMHNGVSTTLHVRNNKKKRQPPTRPD